MPSRLQVVLSTLVCTAVAAGCNVSDRRSAAAPARAETPPTRVRNELKNPATVFVAYARLQEQQGRLNQARENYGAALDADPKSRDAQLGLARLDQLGGRTAEAEERLNNAVQMYPEDALALEALGQFHASQRRWPLAVEILEKAVSLAPHETSVRYHLAVASAHTGDVPGALEHFTKSVGPAEAHYNVGYILYEEGRFDAAERELIEAISRNPELENAQVLLGDLRARRDDELRLTSGRQGDSRARTQHAGGIYAGVRRSQPVRQTTSVSLSPDQREPAGVRSWSPRTSTHTPVARSFHDAAASRRAATSDLTPAQLEQLRNQQ